MMPPRPDPAPLSETELAELEQRIGTAQFAGLWRDIPRLLATVRALQQQNTEQATALRLLMKESAAMLALAEPELRDVAGHTNVACLRLRIDEAAAALAGAQKES